MTDDERRAIAESVAGKAIESMTRERSIDPSRLGEAIGRAVREALPELDTTRPAITFAEAQKQALALIARRVNGDERAIPLPFDDLDAQFGGGLWPGLHFVTSTTGTGKTALALQIARGAANAGSHVLYVPLELDAPQLAIRMIADTLWDEWRANHKTWETNGKRGHEPPRPPSWSDAYEGRMSGDSKGTAAGHAAAFKNTWAAKFASVEIPRFHVVEGTPGTWDASTLEAELDRVSPPGQTPDRPPLIVVDFLQLVGPLGGPDQRQDPRERIGLVSYHLRDLARRRGAAVLVISSTARSNYGAFYGAKDGSSKAPRVEFTNGTTRLIGCAYLLEASGKESGEVEYAADTVSALLRTPDGEQSIFATAKGRSRGPTRHQWCALKFEGGRFVEGDAGAAAASWAGEDATEASADDKSSGKAKSKGKGGKPDAGEFCDDAPIVKFNV